MPDFLEVPILFPNQDTVRPHLIARSAILSIGPNPLDESQSILLLESRVELQVILTYEQFKKLLVLTPKRKGKR